MNELAHRTYPLELILRPHGTAELVNKHDETLWASDTDDDFKEEFSEFLTEDDLDDVLDFLEGSEIISLHEAECFASGEWEVTIESLDEPEDSEESANDD